MLFRPDESEMQHGPSMIQWTVREVEFKEHGVSRHLCGIVNNYGRVCSPLQSFNEDTNTFTSRSGKIYNVAGDPGHNSEAEYVWNQWCRMNGVEPGEYIDVTHEYFNVSDTEEEVK
jgi:hypothetical protein